LDRKAEPSLFLLRQILIGLYAFAGSISGISVLLFSIGFCRSWCASSSSFLLFWLLLIRLVLFLVVGHRLSCSDWELLIGRWRYSEITDGIDTSLLPQLQ
jgi:hypothetical protein